MLKILLAAEVQPLLLDVERSFLRRTDCEVLKASMGEEILEKARAHAPDLILLEPHLEGMDGVSCCQAIKADAGLRHIPVIFLAGAIDNPRCLEAGGDGILSGPVTPPRLLEALRRFVPTAERASERIAVAMRVDYTHGILEGLGFTRNLGVGGLFLQARDPFESGDVLEMAFRLGARARCPFHVRASVVHAASSGEGARAAAGAGVRFLELSSSDRIEIGRFVREHEGGEK